MTNIRFNILFAFLGSCLACLPAYAGEGTFRYGLALQDQKPTGSSKLFGAGYRERLKGPLWGTVEGGLWNDSRGGMKSSGYTHASLGIRPQSGAMFMQASIGPGLITTTDSLLSTNLEFFHDLMIGFQGDDGAGVSVGWKHISNAGMKLPNKGRDFVGASISIKF